jgi:hypothetical protein
MTTYNQLKKIIPPDQALANQALSRSLRQVKDIFDTDLPAVARAVSVLESNRDLDLISALETPLPAVVANVWGNTFATGSGPDNTITINDVIGIAAGATVDTALPETTEILQQLESANALISLTANTGNAFSADNGVYTVMSYCLAGEYTTEVEIDPGDPFADPPVPPTIEYTVDIPNTVYFTGDIFISTSLSQALSEAFANVLIPAGDGWISNIANANPEQANICNNDSNAMAHQLELNVINSTAAGIDIGNVVNDIANANLIANSVSVSLGIAGRLHDIGLDVTEGGAAQFFEATANTSNLPGQAVIASMREGRNIAVLNAVGIELDTQLPDLNLNTTVANNLGNAQYSVAEARANISL